MLYTWRPVKLTPGARGAAVCQVCLGALALNARHTHASDHYWLTPRAAGTCSSLARLLIRHGADYVGCCIGRTQPSTGYVHLASSDVWQKRRGNAILPGDRLRFLFRSGILSSDLAQTPRAVPTDSDEFDEHWQVRRLGLALPGVDSRKASRQTVLWRSDFQAIYTELYSGQHDCVRLQSLLSLNQCCWTDIL